MGATSGVTGVTGVIEGVPGSGDPPVRAAGAVPDGAPPGRIEEAVPIAVARLLEAEDDAELARVLVELVARCGCHSPHAEGGPDHVLRRLPADLAAPEGRDLTLGPVLRALCAAARERASGELRPVAGEVSVGPRGGDDALLSLDLGDLSEVRDAMGDPAARWLVTKLQRTLRSLLCARDRALRYPAGRFLVLLRGGGLARAGALSDRVSLEWDAYLGGGGQVRTSLVEVVEGDVPDALRRIG